MPIQIQAERLMPLAHVPGLACIPRRRGKSGRLHPATVWRWARKGIKGIRLEVVRIGGTTCTSAEALARFFHKLAGVDPAAIASESPNGTSADQTAVERQLDELGVRATGRRRSARPHPRRPVPRERGPNAARGGGAPT